MVVSVRSSFTFLFECNRADVCKTSICDKNIVIQFYWIHRHFNRREYSNSSLPMIYFQNIDEMAKKYLEITGTPAIVKGNKSVNLVWFK